MKQVIIKKQDDCFETQINGALFSSNKLCTLINVVKELIPSILNEQIEVESLDDYQNYITLLRSGMLWEFHPEAKGNWKEDKHLFIK